MSASGPETKLSMKNPIDQVQAPRPPQTPAVSNDLAVKRSLRILQRLTGSEQPSDFAVRFWDGTVWECERLPRFTLILQHAGAVRKMFWPPGDLAVGEAYIYDDIDVEGDAQAFFAFLKNLSEKRRSRRERLVLAWHLLRLPATQKKRAGRQPAQLTGPQHSPDRDRTAISYHYDVSNEFFALWLDSRMIYSCAYFQDGDEDLETAQEGKLDYLCRKLRLKPGERLLDIGCGWGGLVIHAVKHYGVEAVGITLSQRQVELANERIRQAGIAADARVEYLDYRQIDQPEAFDKLVSVGMFEHVGEKKLPEYFQQAWRLLRPGGVFLNHGIALGGPRPRRTAFARRYVFPDGEIVPLTTTLLSAASVGFEIRDVESLREHYALTLKHWIERLESHHEEACQATHESTYRTWRLYMAGAAEGFECGVYNIYQTMLVKPDQGRSGLPLTRADWYA
jgi:cyclopropane-fatty-acyl-phospholipid synthase